MLTKIVLIGPPGAGKSSVGRALSKELSMPFIDSDSEQIELDLIRIDLFF